LTIDDQPIGKRIDLLANFFPHQLSKELTGVSRIPLHGRAEAAPNDIHVATDGNDLNPGTKSKPFQTSGNVLTAGAFL